MSYFKAKMHRIRFPLGLRHRPHCGELTALPRPLPVFIGLISKGRARKEGKEREEEGK